MSWKNRAKKLETKLKRRADLKVPDDPVEFCREWLGYEPYPYMHDFLRDENHFIGVLQARQTGKSFNGTAKLLYLALRYKDSTFLVTAPKFEQVKRIAFKHLHSHLYRMKAKNPKLFREVIDHKGMMRTIIRLKNGSEILAESPVPETIRGHTAKGVYLMEMNFIRDDEDLYTAVLFTLNTTDGYLIAESTPWNMDSVFHDIFHKDEYNTFSRHRVTYEQALPPNGPLTPSIVSMIEEQLKGDPSRWRREMLCEWTEDNDRWLSMSLITFCQDSSLTYWGVDSKRRGHFLVGVDFGKKRDHSVVAVIERKKGRYILRHCYQFRLDTPYGAVIGYVKKLQDNWRGIVSVNCDQTGVGDYIVEDMKRAGVRNVNGVNFTESSKEGMATALKETMRTVECSSCDWRGYVERMDGSWRRTCPECESNIQSLFHIPYDQELYNELNTPVYNLSKAGKIQYSHGSGTHDDRFWAIGMSLHRIQSVKHRPMIK